MKTYEANKRQIPIWTTLIDSEVETLNAQRPLQEQVISVATKFLKIKTYSGGVRQNNEFLRKIRLCLSY